MDEEKENPLKEEEQAKEELIEFLVLMIKKYKTN